MPYPADFGGVIDLFYKIIHLHKLGVKIHLHCFTKNRPEQKILNQYCETVTYYKRKGLFSFSLQLPYIVSSRACKTLHYNLSKDNYPILLEGVHCSYLLYKNKLINRKVLLRLHNVEHLYYKKLALQERNLLKKWYYLHEAKLLCTYENDIANKAIIFAVSTKDKIDYEKLFNAKNITFLPVFLPYQFVKSNIGLGKYCLYHGNLKVNENEQAAAWLIQNVFSKINIPLVIAGYYPSQNLKRLVNKHKNISLVASPPEKNMELLIANAQINVLPSFNETGVKLKLLNALFNGRHIIVNKAGEAGSGLHELCNVADDGNAFIVLINTLFAQPFATQKMQQRNVALKKLYNNEISAKIIQTALR